MKDRNLNPITVVKTFLVLFLLGFFMSAYGKATVAYIEYTTGLDEGTDTLMPGSDWRLEVAPTFSATCGDIAPGLTFYKTTKVPVTSYIDRNLNCVTASHPGFEDETTLNWTDAGFRQEAAFGTEPITCPIFGPCEMQRVVNTSDKFYANLPLENGENGTPNGAAKIFVTKLNDFEIVSRPGRGGTGGVNDLSSVSAQTKYCARVTDATSIEATEETSKTPYAAVNIYNWLPFNITGGGVNGTDAATGRKVEVYKGLSPTALHRLKNVYFD